MVADKEDRKKGKMPLTVFPYLTPNIDTKFCPVKLMGQKERRHSHLGAEADIYQLIYDLGIKIQDEEYIIHESYIMNPESNFWSDCKGAFPFLTGVV